MDNYRMMKAMKTFRKTSILHIIEALLGSESKNEQKLAKETRIPGRGKSMCENPQLEDDIYQFKEGLSVPEQRD